MWGLNTIQAARTPQSKDMAKDMNKYVDSLRDAAKSQVPWLSFETQQRKTRNGKVVVSGAAAKKIEARAKQEINEQIDVQIADGEQVSPELAQILKSFSKSLDNK